MAQRQQLQSLLKAILGTNNVYFQPPATIQMNYPCIIYKRDNVDTEFANNLPYKNMTRYQVTVVDRNPDSEFPAKIGELPMCSFDRAFVADGLNHDAYTLYF